MRIKGDVIMRNEAFLWVALVSGCILLIPLIAMQFTREVNWSGFDFAVMGSLLFGMGSLFVVTARKVDKEYWGFVSVAFIVAFLYLWAELAVGIVTNWGS